MTKGLDKGIFFRILLSSILAGAAFGLFLVSRIQKEARPTETQKDISTIATEVDHQVDTILTRFNIEKTWSKKEQVAIPGTKFFRTERKIMIPPDVLPLQMNLALNRMARQYNGRAIASENIKENLVTIHIELEQYIIQTLILKPVKDLKRPQAKHQIST